MEKLELKHLAPYLPYKLGLRYKEGGFPDVNLGNLSVTKDYNKWVPILHPLSEYCGKTIAKDVMNKLSCDLDTVREIWDLGGGSKSLDKISYKTYIILCKNLVDFNKLIKNNLAIDINTLKP